MLLPASAAELGESSSPPPPLAVPAAPARPEPPPALSSATPALFALPAITAMSVSWLKCHGVAPPRPDKRRKQ